MTSLLMHRIRSRFEYTCGNCLMRWLRS